MTNQAWVPEVGDQVTLHEYDGKKAEVMAIDFNDVCVKIEGYSGLEIIGPKECSPLPTDEDQAVSEMLKDAGIPDAVINTPTMRALYNAGWRKQPQCRYHADEVATVPYTSFFSIGKGSRVYLGDAGTVTITHVERHDLNDQSYPRIVKAEAEKNGKHLLVQYIYAGNGDYVVDIKPLPEK